MHLPLSYRIVERDGLANALGEIAQRDLRQGDPVELSDSKIPARGAIVGRFGLRAGGPLPDFIVVRDEDLADTFAWISAYFAGLTPITQWCRVWRQSEFGRLDLVSDVGLPQRLGPWIGAIIGECLVQANYRLNLKEIPGSAALATATFVAARGSIVWGDLLDLQDLGQRYDDLHQRYRGNHRALSGRDLMPLWFILSDNPAISRTPDGLRTMGRLSELLGGVAEHGVEGLKAIARSAASEFRLPELEECAQGAQSQRVTALDRLASRLRHDLATPVRDALLGFGASMVDPGVAALPDLLRRHTDQMPMAPLWLGAFAGAWAPAKVVNENQGLGRLILKALEARPDLAERPAADIAYDELSRWLGSSSGKRPFIRAMSTRNLNVEIIPGVIAPFSVVNDAPADVASVARVVTPERRVQSLEQSRDDMSGVMKAVREFARRLDRLEASVFPESGTLPGIEAVQAKPKVIKKKPSRS